MLLPGLGHMMAGLWHLSSPICEMGQRPLCGRTPSGFAEMVGQAGVRGSGDADRHCCCGERGPRVGGDARRAGPQSGGGTHWASRSECSTCREGSRHGRTEEGRCPAGLSLRPEGPGGRLGRDPCRGQLRPARAWDRCRRPCGRGVFPSFQAGLVVSEVSPKYPFALGRAAVFP